MTWYQEMRGEIKRRFRRMPPTMIPPWVLDYIIMRHVMMLPSGSTVVELGTFLGGTAVHMALANPGITVHTYDHNRFEQGDAMGTMLRDAANGFDLPLLQAGDIAALQQINLEDHPNIIMHVADTMEVRETDIALVLVDDNRQEEGTLKLLRHLWPRMRDNGVILGDDADTPHVFNAFARFAKEQDIELSIYSKCAKLVKSRRISSRRDNRFRDTLLNSSRWDELKKV